MAPEKTDPEEANTSTVSEDGGGGGVGGDSVEGESTHHDPYFEPVVTLPEITIKTHEEEEEEMVKLRCKLFRYHTVETPSEWKERGTGDVKILKHTSNNTVRLLMRQDKTLKIRANHYITPYMDLKPNCGSDRAWVWSVVADFADEEPKRELFAIKFANAENARLFKEAFDEARGIVTVVEVKMNAQEEKWQEEETSGDEDAAEKSQKDGKKSAEKSSESAEKSSRTETEDMAKELGKMSVKGDEATTAAAKE